MAAWTRSITWRPIQDSVSSIMNDPGQADGIGGMTTSSDSVYGR
jgi:hypothetical protein